MAFDTAKSKMTKNNFAMGYRSNGTEMHSFVNDATDFGATVYHKVCLRGFSTNVFKQVHL